jgi:hypothetical protein
MLSRLSRVSLLAARNDHRQTRPMMTVAKFGKILLFAEKP